MHRLKQEVGLMASKTRIIAGKIEHNRPITPESDSQFLHHLQNSLLLALAERKLLNPIQLRAAQDSLSKQRRNQGVDHR